MAGGSQSAPGYPAVRAYLYSLKHRGAKYGIDRMRLLAAALGHPEASFPSIHVAGTNGKGSVCAMMEMMYRKNGYRTGLYTSPHLIRQGERVRVDGVPLEERSIVGLTARLRPVAEELAARDPDDHPSFFEFMTAMAFLRFAEAEVGIALIETGLGGRLDATNVVSPELAVITSVSLDHMEQLGDNVAAIAGEKAGILKPGRPVLTGLLPPEAEAVVRRVAEERGCPLHRVADRFPTFHDLPRTNLEGSFQRWNAGVALRAVELLSERFPVEESVTRAALHEVRWPGRWERLPLEDRTLILDATHNAEGVEMLEENLDHLRAATGSKPVVIAGTLGEHRAASLMPAVARHAAAIHLVEARQTRATPAGVLRRFLPPEYDGPVREDDLHRLFPAPGTCLAGKPGDTVVVTGSIYLIGEVMERLENPPVPGEGDLQDVP